MTVEAQSFAEGHKCAEKLFALEPSNQYQSLLHFYGLEGLKARNVAPEDHTDRLSELFEHFKLTAKMIPVPLYTEILGMAAVATVSKGYIANSRNPVGAASESRRNWLHDFYNLLGVYGWDVSQL